MKNYSKIIPKKWVSWKICFLRKKLLITLLLMLSVPIVANQQERKISMKISNVSVQKLFDILEDKTDYTFMYKDVNLSELKNVSLDVEQKDVDDVLKDLMANVGLSYEINENVILVKPYNSQQSQQKKTVKGIIKDEKGEPIPGANIINEFDQTGTISGANGEFSLNVNNDSGNLRVSFIGFKIQTVKFNVDTYINVTLHEDISNLDEVQIVAYGTSTKRQMTGSVASIKGEELANVPVSNISVALQGRVAGLEISNISGAPGGSGVSTVIRGYNSMDQDLQGFSSPLWVIDGVPISNLNSAATGTNALSEIDPSMIESIEVLKDASSAALYGSRAANGVILVTTKKGQKNTSKLSVNVSQSYSYIPELPTVYAGVGDRRYKLDAVKSYATAAYDTKTNFYKYPESMAEAYELYNQGYRQSGYDYWFKNGYRYNYDRPQGILQDSLNTHYNNSTNWFDIFFNSGKVTDANIQASGGKDNMTYNFGLGYYTEDGIISTSAFDRLTSLAKISVTPTKKTTLDFRVMISYSKRKRTSTGLTEQLPDAPFELSPYLPGKGSMIEKIVLDNIKSKKQKNENLRLRANIAFKYDIIKGLNFQTANSMDYSSGKSNSFWPSFLGKNNLSKSNGMMQENISILSENLLTYDTSFNGLHNLNLLGGITYQKDEMTYVRGEGNGSPNDYIEYVRPGFPFYYMDNDVITKMMNYESNFEESVLVSFLCRAKYNYNQKYLFEASLRRDGSSKFGKSVPWGLFPAFSAGWVFSEEDFMHWVPKLDFAKLRASWGKSGNTFAKPYVAYGLISPNKYLFNGNSVITSHTENGLFNDDLSWETTTQYDIGLDVDFFNYRLGVIFDYYYRHTKGLLYNVQLPSNYSFYHGQWQNQGAVSNEGVELTIKTDIIRKEDFNWNLSFNISRNWNMVRKTYDGKDLNLAYTLGKPLNGIYVLETNGLINDASQLPHKYTADGILYYYNSGHLSKAYRPGDVLFMDQNGDGKVSVIDDLVYKGSPLPKAFGGITNSISWKNFDINMLFSYSLGRTIINYSRSNSIRVFESTFNQPILYDVANIDQWEKPGDNAEYPAHTYDLRGNYNGISEMWLEKDVHYIKLKNLIIGYSLPKKITDKIGVNKIRAYVSGENLGILTNYSGIDPETINVNSGVDHGKNYPLLRKFTLGLTVNF